MNPTLMNPTLMNPTLINNAWLLAAEAGHRRFRRALRDPKRAQEKRLRAILRQSSKSEFGRLHGLGDVSSVAQFQRRVPERSAEDFRPFVDRIRTGARGVLTSARVERLLPTSGSTTAPKLVPVTRPLRSEFRAAIDPWIADMHTQHRTLRGGSAYWSVSPAFETEVVSSVPVGFESDASYLGLLAPLAERVFAAPAALRGVRPLGTFQYATLLTLLRRADLRLISVWHPSFFTLLWESRTSVWRQLVEDVRTGACSAVFDEDVPNDVRRACTSEPDRARADRLRSLGVHARPTDVWPKLRVVSAWADGAAAGPARALAELVAPAVLAPKGLVSTEAFASIPFAGRHPLAVASHFLELRDDEGRCRTVDEAQQGAQYELVVTTSGGLCRMRTGDRVRVDGFVGATPSIRFVGRCDRVVDRVGEKLHESFVAQVLGALCPAAAFSMLAPSAMEPGSTAPRYVLFVDASVDPTALDARLRANPHYAYARDLGQLGPPRIFRVAPDAHHAHLRRLHAEGRTLGDLKPTCLDERLDWSAHLPGAFQDLSHPPTEPPCAPAL